MNDITIFTYENANIRTITTEDGTPLFCGKDIASILGYKDTAVQLGTHTGSTLHRRAGPLPTHHPQ